jgi:hypothetical protein
MKRGLLSLTLALLFICALPAWADDGAELKALPGYFDFSELASFAASGGKSTELDVKEPLLSIAMAAMQKDNPELAEMISKIKLVAVRSFPIAESDTEKIKSVVGDLHRKLERAKWDRVVRVVEDKEQVYVYLKSSGSVIEGLTLMAIQYGDEATFVNIVGQIDPQMIQKISGKFSIPNLQGLDLKKLQPEKSGETE